MCIRDSIYEQREYIYKALTDIPGITAVKPQAAFYMFPKIDVKKFNIVNDEKFALDLLQDKKILIVQGSGFNWKQPDHFRVVYLPQMCIRDSYICDEQSDWYPDIEDMRRKITDHTKALVIINPNNPTGALYPKRCV